MIVRAAAETARRLARGFPVLFVSGPRQSGKTTLVRHEFGDKPYASLEDPDARRYAMEDPRAFLAQYPDGAVLDEVQRAPDLLSYIQTIVDQERRMGMYVLTGSQQLGLGARIAQSLAGRAGILELLPLSAQELEGAGMLPPTPNEAIVRGSFPAVYDRGLQSSDWYKAYVRTYVERDVRQLVNVRDLNQFQNFLAVCAGRTGALLNLSGIGDELGLSHNTIRQWISVLESSFIVFRATPYLRNFSKRLVKSPKLYFVDAGLAAWLLGVRETGHLAAHPLRGPLFETWAAGEILRAVYNRGDSTRLSFWRDRSGHEVDLLFQTPSGLHAVEVKAGATVTGDMLRGLHTWEEIAGEEAGTRYLVHGGEAAHVRGRITVVPWRRVHTVAE